MEAADSTTKVRLHQNFQDTNKLIQSPNLSSFRCIKKQKKICHLTMVNIPLNTQKWNSKKSTLYGQKYYYRYLKSGNSCTPQIRNRGTAARIINWALRSWSQVQGIKLRFSNSLMTEILNKETVTKVNRTISHGSHK